MISAGMVQGVHWQRVSENVTGKLHGVSVEPEVGFGGQYIHVGVAASLVVGCRQGGEVGRDFRGAGESHRIEEEIAPAYVVRMIKRSRAIPGLSM